MADDSSDFYDSTVPVMTDDVSDSSISAVQARITYLHDELESLKMAGEMDTDRMTRLDQELKQLALVLDAKEADKEAEEQTRQYKEDLEFLNATAAGHLPQNLRASPTWDYLAPSDHDPGGPSDTTPVPRAEAEPSSGSGSSPDHGSSVPSPPLPISDNPKKRQRESLTLPSLSNGHAAKTMRATPSPAMTGTTTPSSVESIDMADIPGLSRLIGGKPKDHLRELLEDQRAEEKLIAERAEQARQDEELCRQISQQESSGAFRSAQPWGRPYSISRATSQTILDAKTGRFRRVDLPLSSSPAAPQEEPALPYAWQGEPEYAHPYESNRISIKNEKSQQPPNTQSNADSLFVNDFIDLGSGDDWEEIPGDSSSDLVEIDPHSWRENGRDIKPERKLPWINKPGTASGINSWDTAGQDQTQGPFLSADTNPPVLPSSSFGAPYQAGAAYGGVNAYNSMLGGHNPSSWAHTAGIGQTLAGAAKRAFNATYAGAEQQLMGYNDYSSGYGSSYPYGQLGSSLNPQVISDSDLDYYGLPQQSLLHNVLSGHSINANDPRNREIVDRYTDRINYLTNDPTRTSAEIKSLLENIRPDEDLPAENREGTPDAMTYPLMEHQKLGLAWMKSMEEGSNKGGILADDMGLGKTIQALALMVSRRSQDPTRKTTLIVAPVALMKQWEREIKQKLKPGPENRLTCFILHGANRQTTWEQLKTYDVVLTTFGTLANEVKRKDGIDIAKQMNPNWRPITKADQLPLLGEECKWYRVIIDEAQCIKNKNTKAALGAAALQALTRFCMSGTPMMNNVGELYSLIHFLRIKPYDSSERFNRDFTKPLKQSYELEKNKAMQKLQALLKAILLRRTKKSKIDGAPILSLPERTTESQHAAFSDDELAFYRALESQTQLQFNKYLKAGTVGRNYSNVLVLLLRLRQACCHPHLIKDFGMSSGGTDVSLRDMLVLAKELAPDVVARIKEQGGMNEQSALECPVCMDMAENATIFIPCGHSTCSECFARISDPSQAIAGGDADGRNVDIKCPSCRGKVITTKVIDHAAFKKVHMPEENGADPLDPQADVETTDESDSESEDSDDSDDSEEMKDFIVPDDVTDHKSDVEQSGDEPGEETSGKGKKKQAKAVQGESKPKKSKKGKGKAKAEKEPKKTLAQLKKEGARNAKARRHYLRRLEREWETSGKIQKVMEILQATQDRRDNEKTIIFSQFTSLLDLLEIPISRQGWGYKRYDGSMSSNARNEAVIEFSDNPCCKIMLVSLKAGNSGLNLVAASQVIIFDPFWNPYIEEQAIDRAHRIGQMRPVQVHRILVPDTVEDRILALQEKKRALIEGALDEKASQSIGRLGTRELAFLFGVSG
ncbi:hypothetical protein MMC07_008198 [Pseudocyphellaria aurata]|nr:hypothetical protein [Pseudocyphellaria aurata]